MVTLLRSFLNFLYQKDALKSQHRFFKLNTFNRKYFLLIALFSTVTNIASAQHNYFIKQSYHSIGSPANDYIDTISYTDYAKNKILFIGNIIFDPSIGPIGSSPHDAFYNTGSKVPFILGPGSSKIYKIQVYYVNPPDQSGTLFEGNNLDTLTFQTSPGTEPEVWLFAGFSPGRGSLQKSDV